MTVWRKVLIGIFTILTIAWVLLLSLGVALALNEGLFSQYNYHGMQPYTLDQHTDILWYPKNPQSIQLPTGSVTVQDFNGDGNLEVFREESETHSGGFFPSGPTHYYSSLYGFQNGEFVLYFALKCDSEELKPYRLHHGTYAFTNRPMAWHFQAYRFRHGNYQQCVTFIPAAYSPLLIEYINLANALALLPGLIPAILVLLTLRPAVVKPRATFDDLAHSRRGFGILTVIVLGFDLFCFYNGYHPGMGACVAATVPLFFVCIMHLAIIQVRMKALKLCYNT